MCRSETLLTIFFICGLADVVNDRSVVRIWRYVVLIEQKAREHGLFEAAENKKERAGFNDGCDPARPAPATSVRDSSASDEPETVTILVWKSST